MARNEQRGPAERHGRVQRQRDAVQSERTEPEERAEPMQIGHRRCFETGPERT